MKTTAVLILAAGEAKRMGTPKQLLPYKNTTLLGAALEEAMQIKEAHVYVVLGAQSDSIAKAITAYDVQILEHANWKQGLGTSLAYGVKNVQAYDRALILLADQPNITATHLQKLIEKSKEVKEGIVATEFQNMTSVPAVFTKSYYKKLMELKGDKGAKSLFSAYKSQLHTVCIPEVFKDIDQPEDYRKLIEESNMN